MRKLVAVTQMTLDGVMQAPGGPEEDPSGGFEQKRVFGEGTVPAGLTLVDSKVTTTGVVIATYRPAGRVQSGSFAFEEPTEREIERRKRLDA
jgi:hypothetical protein